jgi:hypothetical protein
MKKPRKTIRNANPAASAAGGRRFPGAAVIVLAVAVVAGGGFWWSKDRHVDAPQAATPTTATQTTNPPPSDEARRAFEILKGRWVRAEGGYIVEIRSVESSGKMEAAYLNPRPIHVARAEASKDGESVKVFIELRDVNYPGSTYTLSYQPATDRLVGTYFHAVSGQNLDVGFSRVSRGGD